MAKRKNRSSVSDAPQNSQAYQSAPDTVTDQATDMSGVGTRADSMGSEPSEEDIRMRAYSRYLERGGGDGQDFEDWLEAERELKGGR